MPKITVQQRKVKVKGKEYQQYWIALPKVLCESMGINKGSELEAFNERGDLILKKKDDLIVVVAYGVKKVVGGY
jgi:bifunctional DNA-binding transcriptional regulator/antitoxin component of YhaV-PrlF toxin-antitoxin module